MSQSTIKFVHLNYLPVAVSQGNLLNFCGLFVEKTYNFYGAIRDITHADWDFNYICIYGPCQSDKSEALSDGSDSRNEEPECDVIKFKDNQLEQSPEPEKLTR